eukprot:scaffold22589_cov138-Cylindrotheca_fusiformis.AAC.61
MSLLHLKRGSKPCTMAETTADSILSSPRLSVMIAAYVALGALHELAHVLVAKLLSPSNQWPSIFSLDSILAIVMERRVVLDIGNNEDDGHTEGVIRNAGWIVSVFLAWLMCHQYGRLSPLGLASIVTAVEALTTDLCGFGRLLPVSLSQAIGFESVRVFYCGNFGILLLHHWWLTNRGRKSALDCLEQMVSITMMRGAQSGGVVTYVPSDRHSMKAIRTRVVNRKRTDLSKQIRNRVQKSFKPRKGTDGVLLAGHTRFATSSMATLSGTHPHRWSPGSFKRVYSWSTNQVQTVWVENFITHNGDFDFYTIHGQTYDLEVIQNWLSVTTGVPTPAIADSCAIAGVMDILRAKGCFGLAIRYSICFGNFEGDGNEKKALQLLNSVMDSTEGVAFPQYKDFDKLGTVFEEVLNEQLSSAGLDTSSGRKCASLEEIGDSITARTMLAQKICVSILKSHLDLMRPITSYIDMTDAKLEEARVDLEMCDFAGSNLFSFCMMTVNAFFDNDLFQSTKTFLKNAKGSFGLSTSSTLDADHQVCFAARGQTLSVSFYPDKGLVCFGSEQAATKAGMNAMFQGDDKKAGPSNDGHDPWVRLDLDDLGGEIIVLDWGTGVGPVSKPNRHLPCHEMMNGKLRMILHQESKTTTVDPEILHRTTQLSLNRLIRPPKDPRADVNGTTDLVLQDIEGIPNVCKNIQVGWHSMNALTSMNRFTAYSLSSCLRRRLRAHVKGAVPAKAVDILLTGCEVSLWLAEQFASDLQKCFPKLTINAISSNKLLGLFGQELAVPAMGFSYSPKTMNLNDTIVIIVSHSGGTFAPLACSNLLQSATKNIFVVTSEWDTQIGKQLRAMDALDGGNNFTSRIFSTEIGVRPAEPCSVSVAATHQLLTNLLEYISVVILSDSTFARVTAAVITVQDLKVLERCNHMNIDALSEITGTGSHGYKLDRSSQTRKRLLEAGDLWAEHVLENARAYIMSFIYIFVTVTAGFPIVYAIAHWAGLDTETSPWVSQSSLALPAFLSVRLVDSAIYFWLPQINITLIRLWQGRNLRHRMVGRTVVIGDIPWVAQSAEAFLSKIFAVSYSIAGLNVLSGNPNDHLVHRHTHRVVRGTLAIVGRPDGRLTALSTAEAAVCLSVNQASSIQSWGGTCESITIGHNPFKLDLTINGIFLKRHRPLFLCERLLVETDANQEQVVKTRNALSMQEEQASLEQPLEWRTSVLKSLKRLFSRSTAADQSLNYTHHRAIDCSVSLARPKRRSAPALLGAYLNIEEKGSHHVTDNKQTEERSPDEEKVSVDDVVSEAISVRKWSSKLRQLFQTMDVNKDGVLSKDEFIAGIVELNPKITEDEATVMFREMDTNGNSAVSIDEFLQYLEETGFDAVLKAPPSHRDARGIIQVEMAKEKYFGEDVRKLNAANKSNGKEVDFLLVRNQHLSQELYESRIASLQRFVSMTVLFHQMGKRVEKFFSTVSFGLWSYRFDRTHSIMRIATTASPVSGSDVRQRMEHLRLLKKVENSLNVISSAYLAYRQRKKAKETMTVSA